VLSQNPEDFESNSKSWVRVPVRVRVQVRVRVLKIRTRVRLEYIAGLEYYITAVRSGPSDKVVFCPRPGRVHMSEVLNSVISIAVIV